MVDGFYVCCQWLLVLGSLVSDSLCYLKFLPVWGKKDQKGKESPVSGLRQKTEAEQPGVDGVIGYRLSVIGKRLRRNSREGD